MSEKNVTKADQSEARARAGSGWSRAFAASGRAEARLGGGGVSAVENPGLDLADDAEFALDLFRQVLDASTGATRLSRIADAWRSGEWRADFDSWEEYLQAEHGTPSRTPRSRHHDTRSVYLIQAENGRVKIGVAADPSARLAGLQTGSPVLLRLVAVIPGAGATGERELHERFGHLRAHGEWFEMAPELAVFIEQNSA